MTKLRQRGGRSERGAEVIEALIVLPILLWCLTMGVETFAYFKYRAEVATITTNAGLITAMEGGNSPTWSRVPVSVSANALAAARAACGTRCTVRFISCSASASSDSAQGIWCGYSYTYNPSTAFARNSVFSLGLSNVLTQNVVRWFYFTPVKR